MNRDLDTLATRLYVTIDDLLVEHPEWAPERPAVGAAPRLSDAGLLTVAVLQALLGYTSEARFVRYAHTHLRPWFPYLPDRPGYNKRLRHDPGTRDILPPNQEPPSCSRHFDRSNVRAARDPRRWSPSTRAGHPRGPRC